ncbi:unnamed protein product [Protopolystoma xenopodis]|uniref:Uncharacterized protein n=1 Tax=Protopolystoma xenopodis TaxID=117903 RepID=A0A3S5AIZ0_9PLAT|nr:unnamed protein product [Protopolystoma xenopodis]
MHRHRHKLKHGHRLRYSHGHSFRTGLDVGELVIATQFPSLSIASTASTASTASIASVPVRRGSLLGLVAACVMASTESAPAIGDGSPSYPPGLLTTRLTSPHLTSVCRCAPALTAPERPDALSPRPAKAACMPSCLLACLSMCRRMHVRRVDRRLLISSPIDPPRWAVFRRPGFTGLS